MSALIGVAVILIASWAGVRVAQLARWTTASDAAGLPLAAGLAAAPLLLGAVGVVQMLLLGPAVPTLHLAVTVATIAVVGLFARRVTASQSLRRCELYSDPFVGFALGTYALVLCALALLAPRSINDALEYLLVTRDLLQTTDLASTYPGIVPASSPSGFFFAWTHPPTFVTLQYLFASVEGWKNGAGMSNVVAAWAALSTAAGAWALGSAVDRRAGGLTALMLLATPLYFLGAAGGLIDALPVLGAALVCVTLVGSDVANARFAPATGVALGLALWTHSVAVLFVPIALLCYAVRVRTASRAHIVRGLTIVVVSAALIGALPYVRNMLTLGTFVGDSTAVVRMASLGWEQFYDYTRGVNSLTARIQYGVLKGIFAPEAYGATFALAFAGLGVWLHRWRAQRQAPTTELVALTVCALWVGAFVGGTALSLLMGTNILIRNERYFLSALAPGAVLASVALLQLWDSLRSRGWWRLQSRIPRIGFSLLSLGGLAILVMFVAGPVFRTRAADATGRRIAWPNLRVIDWIDRNLPGDARVLSFRPGDFAYTSVAVMTHLDDRLVNAYEADGPVAAIRQLDLLGIEYVHVSDYAPPSLYQTPMADIVSNPALSSLLYADAGHEVYRLRPAALEAQGRAERISPALTRYRTLEIGGRKAIASRIVGRAPVPAGSESRNTLPLNLFQRHHTTIVGVGAGDAIAGPVAAGDALPVSGSEVVLRVSGDGDGHMRVFVVQYDLSGRPLGVPALGAPAYLGEFVVVHGQPFVFARRARLAPTARSIRLLVQHHGNSRLRVSRVSASSYQ